ncbi:YbaB/EbfC family nucleoid-associated protein [Micromonospora marina]|uniref:YbaB/EbfC family nucleoid-associated protein n=1 Tax=Micromonospora marina TaxID=307120 RepID=UPI003453AD93
MSYDQHIEALTATYRQQLADLQDMQTAVAGVTASASGPRNSVSVTVDGEGAVVDLGFPTGAYRTMAPAELATLIRDVLGEARARAVDEVQAIVRRYRPGDGSLDLDEGLDDWCRLLPSEPVVPPMVREYLQRPNPDDRGPGAETSR